MARDPVRMSSIISEVLTRRGLGRVLDTQKLEAAWKTAVFAIPNGEMIFPMTAFGKLQAGRFEVMVGHTALLQELNFQKKELLEVLRRELPERKINDLRLKSGKVG